MIGSAAEFVRLRRSRDPSDYHRAAHESASIEVWLDVIERYPEMRVWVAVNKTVPLEILEILRADPDERVQSTVREKRSWARAHPDDSTRVGGLENTRSAASKRRQIVAFDLQTLRELVVMAPLSPMAVGDTFAADEVRFPYRS